MTKSSEEVYQPSCRAATGGGCSGCGLAYDCERARAGRMWAWPLVAILIVGTLAVLI